MTQTPELWANVLRLATDELLFQRRAPDAWELLSRCCEPYRTRGEAAEAAAIALGVAEEAGLFASQPDRRVRADYDDVRAATERLLVDTRLAPKQRDIAGRLLGDGRRDRGGPQRENDLLQRPPLGHDLRKGVGLRPDGLPDIDWVPIPEADPKTGRREFIYQEKQRRVEPIFWMAKYPITYAQYRAFLEAEDGFRNSQWWRGLAAPEKDRKRPGEQRFPYWNHPAENVSWYDAFAFCRWLTEKVKVKVEAKVEGWERLLPSELVSGRDWKITLPTEWQWEKAARGHDGRKFPWGKEYVSGNANIDENYGDAGPHYLQKTSAVGMYPHEKPEQSSYGGADLSGSVWEWCLNEYRNPNNTGEGGDATRVLRGGSWTNNVDNAAASFRNRNNPINRNNSIGFRVVAVSASTLFCPFSGGLRAHD